VEGRPEPPAGQPGQRRPAEQRDVGVRQRPGERLGVALPPQGIASAQIAQGRPKLWAHFRALIGIFGQSVGPSLAIWVNPVQVLLLSPQIITIL